MDCSHTRCFSRIPRDKNLGNSNRVNAETTQVYGTYWSADWESMVKRLYRDVGCMWSWPILLEPLYIWIHTTTCFKCAREFVRHINVTLLRGSDSLLVCILKPKRSDYSLLRWSPRQCISPSASASSPSTHGYCYWHLHRARSVLGHWIKYHQGSQDPLKSCSRTIGTSLNVFLCQLVWVYV